MLQDPVTIPLKNTKSPMVRVMKNIHATLETNCSISNKVKLGQHLDELIKELLDMAVACAEKKEHLNISWQLYNLGRMKIDMHSRLSQRMKIDSYV